MPGNWVIGALAQNIWSYVGPDDVAKVNKFLFQYFVNYNLSNGWYLSMTPIITAICGKLTVIAAGASPSAAESANCTDSANSRWISDCRFMAMQNNRITALTGALCLQLSFNFLYKFKHMIEKRSACNPLDYVKKVSRADVDPSSDKKQAKQEHFSGLLC